jgi:serine/threonine protein kinase/Flp pilus assembly protein TadD
MFSPSKDQVLLCEQCGVALPQHGGDYECLHCLLTGGLEIGDRIEEVSPNEYNTRFYQHYEILTRPDGTPWELGRGAMGVTYKARDLHLNTPVALKLINARFALRSDAQRRFLREAQAAARLRHPNVASVFHFGMSSNYPELATAESRASGDPDCDDCFYAMEFIEGETLAARLKRSGPLSPELALALGVQASRALSAAEHRGLIHRDLKPSNIMLASKEFEGDERLNQPGQGWVRVIDFGLAKLADDGEGSSARFIGTRAFASPEQIQSRTVDCRSDIYSLGATLWYSLTGKAPSGEEAKNDAGPDLKPGLRRSTVPLRERAVPPSVIALLEAALAFDPNERPGTALEFGQRLQNCLDELVSARNVGAVPRVRPAFRRWALGTAAATIIAALFVTAGFLNSKNQLARERSIAVLPFRDLGDDPTNTGFAERVQADLLSRLSRIRNLKVTNLVAAARYSSKTGRDLQEIGRIFGIRHVLEGSLRRTNDHVYLHLALIDTQDGHELWAEGYDRKLADAISLRSDVATDIADALDATVSLEEKSGVTANPLKKPDAYALYLRGRKFEQTLSFAISDYEAAEMLYSQAIALDPRFALAHARLASTLGLLYCFRGPNEELKARAYAEAREALRLQPDLGEARLAQALCEFRMDSDFDRVRIELEEARRFLPDETEIASSLASMARHRGEWREARTEIQRCLAHEPENVTYQEELYTTAYLLRDWQAAQANASGVVTLAPEQTLAKAQRAMVEVWKNGDVRPLQSFLANLPTYGDAEGILTWLRWNAAMMMRDFVAARTAVDSFPFETLSSVYGAPIPKAYLEGCLALAMGEKPLAVTKFELCRPAYEAEALAHPESALRHARLGLLYAYLGRHDEAIREGQRAVDLKPSETDHVEGSKALSNLALIYARLGHTDRALTMIQSLLQMPGAVFFGEASISLWELRLRWEWDPLRADSRFQAILTGPEPPTNY